MIAIVRLALKRPYTFIVMAILIVIFGGLAAVETPTDIFPDIQIPVIAAVWTYRGLSPDDMAGRVIYYYERQLSTAVNDIDHIESQSLPGVGIVKIFFHPDVDIRTATAQVTSLSQTVLKQMPPGITPPLILNYNASTVPILQLGLSSPDLAEKDIFDLGQNFIRPSLASVQGAGNSLALWRTRNARSRSISILRALQAHNLSAQDLENALAAQNQIIPAGTIKVGSFEYNVKLNNSPSVVDELNNLPVKQVNGATIYMGDVAHVRDGAPPQRNEVRMDGRRARADDGAEERLGLDPQYRGRRQGAAAAPETDIAEIAQGCAAGRPVHLRARRGLRRDQGRRHRRCPDQPDDPFVPGMLALHPGDRDLHSAGDPVLHRAAVGDWARHSTS